MRNRSTFAVAAVLMLAAITAAAAQASGSARAARAPAAPIVSTDPYGERPTDPNRAVPCSERPFAIGCDKRGFW